ncbi:hypothetical protein G0S96_001060 [Campylobacter jejuni]|nr:hypothetical protein [Campylobacter jejuni]
MKKITKKEIFSYAIFIAIIALICIFKFVKRKELWRIAIMTTKVKKYLIQP